MSGTFSVPPRRWAMRRSPSIFAGCTRRLAAQTPPLADCDAVLVRTMPPGSLEQVVFRMDLLHRLMAGGVRVLNPPRAVEVCVDKYLATALLDAAGLPVPHTIVCQHADAALEAFTALGGDVVVKPLFGSEGAAWCASAIRNSPGAPSARWSGHGQRPLFAAIRATSGLGPPCVHPRQPGADRHAADRAAATGGPTSPRAASAKS